jgi:hypothetical protein
LNRKRYEYYTYLSYLLTPWSRVHLEKLTGIIPICNNKSPLNVFIKQMSDDGFYQAETSCLKILHCKAVFDAALNDRLV